MILKKIRSAITKSWSFTKDVCRGAARKVKSFVRGMYDHAEATTILILSSLGVTAILSEIPFYWALPIWIEAPMVIPILSVAIISVMVWNANRRTSARMAMAA